MLCPTFGYFIDISAKPSFSLDHQNLLLPKLFMSQQIIPISEICPPTCHEIGQYHWGRWKELTDNRKGRPVELTPAPELCTLWAQFWLFIFFTQAPPPSFPSPSFLGKVSRQDKFFHLWVSLRVILTAVSHSYLSSSTQQLIRVDMQLFYSRVESYSLIYYQSFTFITLLWVP